MAFRVEVEPQAFEDLDAIAEHIKNQSSFEAAERWFRGMIRSIHSLEQMPGRCPVAAESEELNHEVRLLLHGRKNRAYKIYFAIHVETQTSGTVHVLHVRHWARRELQAGELQSLLGEIHDETE